MRPKAFIYTGQRSSIQQRSFRLLQRNLLKIPEESVLEGSGTFMESPEHNHRLD